MNGKIEQLKKFSEVVSFYEKKIEEYLCKGDVDLATNWYYEMCGACFLAEQQGLIDDPQSHHDRQREVFKRILDMKYGNVGKKEPPADAGTSARGASCGEPHNEDTSIIS